MCIEWNSTHSYDSMTPSVLKATYYRAAADKDVQEEIFRQEVEALNHMPKEEFAQLVRDVLTLGKIRPQSELPPFLQEKMSRFFTVLVESVIEASKEAEKGYLKWREKTETGGKQ